MIIYSFLITRYSRILRINSYRIQRNAESSKFCLIFLFFEIFWYFRYRVASVTNKVDISRFVPLVDKRFLTKRYKKIFNQVMKVENFQLWTAYSYLTNIIIPNWRRIEKIAKVQRIITSTTITQSFSPNVLLYTSK